MSCISFRSISAYKSHYWNHPSLNRQFITTRYGCLFFRAVKLDMLASHGFHFSLRILEKLLLLNNTLAGRIPSVISTMKNLGATVASTLVKMETLFSLCYLTFPLYFSLVVVQWAEILWLNGNNFTGPFTCPNFIDLCWISCNNETNEECRQVDWSLLLDRTVGELYTCCATSLWNCKTLSTFRDQS